MILRRVANAGAYDAYVRDGLKPWSQQLDSVHRLLDKAPGALHEEMRLRFR